MTAEIAVIDYGVGNLLSVLRALEHCGASPYLVQSPKDISNADFLVLPGVGAFSDGMNALTHEYRIADAIKEFSRTERPFLGICLGMQMMLSISEEFGIHSGLDLVPGKVVGIPKAGPTGVPHKVPHIGWNKLRLPSGRQNWNNTILQNVSTGDAVYFVHSFTAAPVDQAHRLADCDYNGCLISAAIQRNQFVGCQFHPEKSGAIGLRILKSFVNL